MFSSMTIFAACSTIAGFTGAICEIMNTGISRGDIQGWQAHKTAKRYPKYGVQKGWERVTSPETGAENFSEITDAEAQQLGFPF